MSDTPRTDAEINYTGHENARGEVSQIEYVEADFARQLERELNIALKQNA